MDMLQIAGAGIICAVAVSLIRNWKSELAIPAAVASGVLLLTMVMGNLRVVVEAVASLSDKAPGLVENIPVLLKITGIAFITEFAGSVCRDSGESSIAGKIETAGRIFIVCLALPLATGLIQTIQKMLVF